MFLKKSIASFLKKEDDSLVKNDELANGDFQPIQNPPQVDDVSQPPVHSLISSYNRNSLKETDGDNKIMKPIPAPRKIKTDKSVDKPVPSPRPLTKSYSLEDIDSLSIGTDAVHFASKKPKIRPKPSILTRQKSLDANIFHTTENKLVEKPPVGKLIDFSDSEQLKDSSETQLNSSKSYDVSPYEIVDLKSKPQEEYSISLIPEFNNSIKKNGSIILPVPLSPVLSPKSSPNSPTSPCQYIDMDRPVEEDSYLSPIEAMSPLSSPQNENSKKDLPKTPITPTNLKKKDNSNSSSSKFKFNKVKLPRKGKSLTGIQKGPLLDEKRRGSAPNIKDQKIMDCENMLYQDMGSARPVSSPSFYEPLYDIVPTEEGMADDERQEDEERWASDEFEDDEDSDEGEYTEVAQEESKPIPKLPDLDGPSRKLYNIATEILSTERAYVKRLHLLDQIFQKELVELTKEDGSITEKTIREIFANLTQIHQFHSDCFLPKFEERIFEWSTVNKIGDIFIKWGNFLRLYTVFVQNFDHSTKTISHCLKKYPKFAEVVEKIQKYPECENLSLQHHMLEPIQRVPRYKLLLNDYIKKLPADSPDKKDAEESLKNISMIAQEANNSMKENDKFKKLLDIEERISEGLKGESLVTASRIFLKEGELTKLAARKNTSSTSRTVLLFSDILLCCAVTPAGKLRVRQIMDLEGLSIEREETLPELAFRIKSRQRVLDLLPRDVTEKDDWINAINDAVNEFSTKRGSLIKRAMEEYDGKHGIDKPGQSAPVWVKDEDVTMCMLCAAKFGLIHRKHHCRGCGRVTCDSCSNYRAPLAYMSNKVSRVCYACSEKLGLQVDKTLEESEVKQSAKSRDSSLGVDISGELYWKSPSKSWNKEWIFLTQFTLYIQKKRQDVMARFTLPLPGYSVDKPSSADEIESSHPHCVKLHKNNKKEHTYYISSESKETMERWRNHLMCATKLETYQE